MMERHMVLHVVSLPCLQMATVFAMTDPAQPFVRNDRSAPRWESGRIITPGETPFYSGHIPNTKCGLSKLTPHEVCSKRNETTKKKNSNSDGKLKPGQHGPATRDFCTLLFSLGSTRSHLPLGFKIIYINTLGRCEQRMLPPVSISMWKHCRFSTISKPNGEPKTLKTKCWQGKMANLRKECQIFRNLLSVYFIQLGHPLTFWRWFNPLCLFSVQLAITGRFHD